MNRCTVQLGFVHVSRDFWNSSVNEEMNRVPVNVVILGDIGNHPICPKTHEELTYYIHYMQKKEL